MNRRAFLRTGLALVAGLAVVGCSGEEARAPLAEPTAVSGGASPAPVATPGPRPRGYAAPGTRMDNENPEGFYVRFIMPVAAPDPARWQLQITGLVDAPTTMTLDHIQRNLPLVEQNTRMKCVECWSSRVLWGGFTYDAFAALVKPAAEATHLFFECDDNYYESLAISELERKGALFATHMDGLPLGAKHGAPLRMVIPWLYGYKGAKTIHKIEFRSRSGKGYWSTVAPYSPAGIIQPGADTPLDLDGRPRRIEGGEITSY